MTMIINCSLCGVRFYADTKHECAKSDPRVIELLEKILDRLPERESAEKGGLADDLSGETVEPGDLRAGDRVGFTRDGERTACTLVSEHSAGGYLLRSDAPCSRGYRPVVVSGDKWCHGISDVRLIERAAREDEGPDEALARVLREADEWFTESTQEDYLRMARAAREHIYAEPDQSWVTRDIEEAEERYRAERARAEQAEGALDAESLARICQKERAEHAEAKRDEWKERAEKAEGVCAILEDRVKFWQEEKRLDSDAERSYLIRAKKAEDERDAQAARAEKAEADLADMTRQRDEERAWRKALRSDVETRWAFVDDNFLKDILHSILKGDDERAKGEQR